MDDKHEGRDAPAPGTYGELRRQLAENGDPWSVDPLISDYEPLPKFALGPIPEDRTPLDGVRFLSPKDSVRELILDLPPNDPGLRQVWSEAGLSLERIPEAIAGDRPEERS